MGGKARIRLSGADGWKLGREHYIYPNHLEPPRNVQESLIPTHLSWPLSLPRASPNNCDV